MPSTSAMRFVDTNVFLYAASTRPEEAGKRTAARKVLEAPDLGLSTQVLLEFYAQATRQNRKDALTHSQATRLIDSWRRYPVQPVTDEIVGAALKTKERYQLSIWDACIVEAARALGARRILTEDLQDGMNLRGIRIVNPFRG